MLGLAILQLGLGTCFFDSYLCVYAKYEMASLMALLSFPAGLLAILLVSPFVEGGTPFDYSVLWLAMFVAGFVQWFVVIPNLRGPRLITLGLLAARDLNQPDSSVLEPVPTRPAKSRRRHRRSIPAYDRHGLTPLERAIRTRSPNR
jgi:hypothetical protein